jgi:hypothetical protein
LFPTTKNHKEGLKTAQARLAESKTGKFNIQGFSQKVAEAMARNTVCQVDAADYVGPVEIVDIPGKGKGVVVTRDIKPGTLLMASKPLAWSPPPNDLPVKVLLMDWEKNASNGLQDGNRGVESRPICLQKPTFVTKLIFAVDWRATDRGINFPWSD